MHTHIYTINIDRAFHCEGNRGYNFTGMDGGRFLVPYYQYLPLILALQNSRTYNCGLTFHFNDYCKLFFDIDDRKGYTLIEIKQNIVTIINETFDIENIDINDLFVTKNQSCDKYHIYTNIIVSRQTLRQIAKKVNQKMEGKQVVDEGASTLRVDGFNKWNRNTNDWSSGTRYLPVDGSDIDSDFYEKTFIIEDIHQPTPFKAQINLNQAPQAQSDVLRRSSNSNSNANNISVSEAKEDENSNEEVNARNTICSSFSDVLEKYPWVNEHLQQHTVTRVNVRGSEIFLDLSKSEEDRLCPFSNRVHRYVCV